MMIRSLKSCATFILVVLLLFLPHVSFAQPYYGANFSYTLLATSPGPLHGYQLMLQYDPQRFRWRGFNLYFDGGFSSFRAPHAAKNREINIYSIAPILRYSFTPRGFFQPYLELSIGLSYLNHTWLENAI